MAEDNGSKLVNLEDLKAALDEYGGGVEAWGYGNIVDLEDGIYVCTGSHDGYQNNYSYEVSTKPASSFPLSKKTLYAFNTGNTVIKFGRRVIVLASASDSVDIVKTGSTDIYKTPIATFIGEIGNNKIDSWTIQQQQIPDPPADESKFLNGNLDWVNIGGGSGLEYKGEFTGDAFNTDTVKEAGIYYINLKNPDNTQKNIPGLPSIPFNSGEPCELIIAAIPYKISDFNKAVSNNGIFCMYLGIAGYYDGDEGSSSFAEVVGAGVSAGRFFKI